MVNTSEMGEGAKTDCWYCNLGIAAYDKAYELQNALVDLRQKGLIDDTILLLEHPPTITVGKFGKMENVLLSPGQLKARGIELCRSNRGGDTTFHCPGQLVCYPIMDVRKRVSLRQYLTDLEEVVIKVLKRHDICGQRWKEHPGIWVEGQQIAAVGLYFSRGISMHGISLNVDPPLEMFEAINLCGIAGAQATSIAARQGKVGLESVREELVDALGQILKVNLHEISAAEMLGEVLGQTTGMV